MGIKNGTSTFLPFIRNGQYNRNCEFYKIIVDGEYMRYKGMIGLNLSKSNAEECIAKTSYNYMHNVIHNIEGFIGRCAKEIRIYMDGTRVSNKETTRADFNYDAGLIRLIFKKICEEHGHSVLELQHGESELQMYLQRDKTMPLNVFLTNDSDMISICYGHRPTSNTGKFIISDSPAVKYYDHQLTSNTGKPNFSDTNCVYDEPKNIVDSCVWINCTNEIVAIGFDMLEDRLIYSPEVFRIFVALCGTDFTNDLLTNSMIRGILNADCDDRKFINTLSDINEIAACLQMLGIRNGGTIKRATPSSKANNTTASIIVANDGLIAENCINLKTGQLNAPNYNPNELSQAVSMYREYIITGKMDDAVIPRPNTSNICRQYLYAMKGQNDDFVKNNLMVWAKQTTLAIALDNFRLYHGTYNPDTCSNGRSKNNKKNKNEETKKWLSNMNKRRAAIEELFASEKILHKKRGCIYLDDTDGTDSTDDIE